MNRVYQLLCAISFITALFGVYLAYTAKIDAFNVKKLAVQSSVNNVQLISNINSYVMWELALIKHQIDDSDSNAEQISFRILALTQLMGKGAETDDVKSSLDDIYNKAKTTPYLKQLADVMKSNIARFRE